MSAIVGFLIARGIGPALAPVIAWGIIILAAGGLAIGGYELIKHVGVLEERARTEKDNLNAVNKALGAAANFDDCLAAGGLWDFRRQKCGRAETGSR
jgi:hypothetical protein